MTKTLISISLALREERYNLWNTLSVSVGPAQFSVLYINHDETLLISYISTLFSALRTINNLARVCTKATLDGN